jgi:molybdenum cofactor cytidylyltransferase
LKKAGIAEQDRARIRGPVGLSIGARSPVEIAISILAELVQMRHAARMETRAAGRVAGVVLAAGLSSRMGTNKLVMEVNNKPLVRHAVDAALEGGLDPVVVVTGNGMHEVETALAGLPITFVHNPDFARGLSTSLNRGIASLPPDVDGAMVLLGDMPGVNAALVVQVKAGFDPAKGRGICVATTGGMRGHPVLWARRFFPEIAALTGDHGAKSLLSAHADQICEIPTPGTAPLMDIDTPSDLAHLAGIAGRL